MLRNYAHLQQTPETSSAKNVLHYSEPAFRLGERYYNLAVFRSCPVQKTFAQAWLVYNIKFLPFHFFGSVPF